MAIRGILLDKDGTIIDYWQTWVPINREAALYAAQGDKALADELLRLGGHNPATDRVAPGTPLAAGDFVDIAEAFAAHPRVAAADRLTAGIEHIFCQGGAKHSALISGARGTIVELKRRGFRVGVATNDSAGGLKASLAQHDILDLFDYTVGCDSGLGSKPDPRMVHGFCTAVTCACARSRHGRRRSARLGYGSRRPGRALTVGVLSGTSAREDLEDYADLILPSINELLTHSTFHSAA